jgi:serine/threonine-protein kinase
MRGPALSLIHRGEGRVEFVASRSVALCGDAPALSITTQGKGPRRVDLSRNVIATRRAFLEDSSKATAAPTVLKLLGNTIARIDGGPSGTLIQQAGSTEPAKQMEWIGDHNTFTGWSQFLTSGASRAVRLASLDDLRRSFPESARQSRVSPSPWPATVGGEWTTPGYLEPLAPEALATLRAVATGNPFLLERSVGAFPKLRVAETVAPPQPPAPPPLGVVKPVPVPKVHIYTETKITAQPATKNATPKTEPKGPLDLTFNLADPALAGDLGRFLAEQVRADARAKHVRVVVDGQGTYPCTPFQVPPGILLEIFVRSPPGTAPPTWRALSGATGDALISAKGADLTILGARFERDGGSSLQSLIHIEDGMLTLADCWLIAPGTVSEEGGTLVTIDSIGSKPLTPRELDAPTIPVTRLTDCLLLTGGKAIEAELGLGVVALSNCAIASGSDALTLIPAKVARFRLAADLWLDRCTVVGNRSIVRLGPWQGKEPGPDRPWRVSSRDCAFLDPFDRGATPRQTAVLDDDPNGLSRGTLVWQSANDAFDVGHFIVMAEGPLPSVNKPDVQREWVAFWGRSHVGRVFGPLRNTPNAPHVRLLNGALTPGSVVPSDLVIDAKYAQAHKTAGIGADVNRLGIPIPSSAPTVPRQPR